MTAAAALVDATSTITEKAQYGGTVTYQITHESSGTVTLGPTAPDGVTPPPGSTLVGRATHQVTATVSVKALGIKVPFTGNCPDIVLTFTVTGTDTVELIYYPSYGPTGKAQLLVPTTPFYMDPEIALPATPRSTICGSPDEIRWSGTRYADNTPPILNPPIPVDAITKCCREGRLFEANGGVKMGQSFQYLAPSSYTNPFDDTAVSLTSSVTLTVARLSP